MEILHPKCAGLDVHRDTVVACARNATDGAVAQEVRTFGATTKELMGLSEWLTEHGVTHVAMEATGVYWKPVWHVLEGNFELMLANAMHIKNVPERKTDVNDATWIADLLRASRTGAGSPAAHANAQAARARAGFACATRRQDLARREPQAWLGTH